MTRRIRIPLLLDVVLVDDLDQLTMLNRHPDISRVISGSGGLVHRMIHRRIYGTLTVGATPLPVFAGRHDPTRAKAQTGLEEHLHGAVPGEVVPRAAVDQLARYVAGEDIGVPIGVAVQQVIGRMFVPGYTATPESWEAARVIDGWARANPVQALWWRASGKLTRSKELIWRLANHDPACIHSTAIALHNVVGALDKMRESVPERQWMTAEEVVAACMVTPGALLRSCTATLEVPFLRKPLKRGTLVMFRLAKIHEGARTNAVSFAAGEWNQCPGHSVVPQLLQAVWTASVPRRGSIHVARSKSGILGRLLVGTFGFINRLIAWHRLPRWLAVANLGAFRIVLRAKNLHDTSPRGSRAGVPEPEWRPEYRHARTPDGTFNDLGDPTMGSTGARFGRNVPVEITTAPSPAHLLEPSPRTISRQLMTRERFVPATTLNLLAACWIQFQNHDWFAHAANPAEDYIEIPLAPGDPWHEPTMRVVRTPADHTRSASLTTPPTFVNDVTHWWDASQIYGSTAEKLAVLRAGEGGKLVIGDDRLLPVGSNGIDVTGFNDNWWVGMSILHTLFTLEHNAICDHLRAAYPGWSDAQLFGTARLVNAALMAKIHTVEWTPGILGHPALQIAMHANWWGLVGERLTKMLGRISESESISGIVGSPTDHHSAPYQITEEFVSVYRLHPLIPDDYTFYALADGRQLGTATLTELLDKRAREAVTALLMENVIYSFGIAHPGAITLHNFPRTLQTLKKFDGVRDVVLDLAAVDILRDRERGVPRYNEFRRRLHMPAAKTFDDITSNAQWAAELREVYKGDLESVDLQVGLQAETPPKGFGFSDTAFRVFILMASRRLKSDRFFTADYRPEVYTPEGLAWVRDNGMKSILLRHYPELAPALQRVPNAFAPWSRI